MLKHESGNRVEKTCALKLLTQLCFDDRIGDTLAKDADLHKYMRQLSLNAKHHRLRECAQTLLFWLESRSSAAAPRKEYVFISHHPSKTAKRVCNRLRIKLAKRGILALSTQHLNENGYPSISEYYGLMFFLTKPEKGWKRSGA